MVETVQSMEATTVVRLGVSTVAPALTEAVSLAQRLSVRNASSSC